MDGETLETTCCIVGGGPAGMMLGLLLARAGIDTVVLEKHVDFFRDFRGDTIHPSTLDLIDQLGLTERFNAIRQSSIRTLDIVVNGNRLTPVDFGHLGGRNRRIALMPQWDFLSLLAEEGKRHPKLRLLMGAEATGLRFDGDTVIGCDATITGSEGNPVRTSISAALTVAADGRDSVLRRASELPYTDHGVAVDVLWFRTGRPAEVLRDTLAYLDDEAALITIPREGYLQCGMLIPKGHYPAIQAAGLDALRQSIVTVAPVLHGEVAAIASWDEVKLLTVQIGRLGTWARDGLLCIGDAAHAMSPAFGVGVNYAIQDAVATANLLAGPLAEGRVTLQQLTAIQVRRMRAVVRMQRLQMRLHEVIAKPGGGAFLPNPMTWWQRAIAAVVLPLLRRIAARVVGRGFTPERIDDTLLRA
ncbi:2-polyprenyl-6-methoxyphenol hydroxylase-like FAD-dependent oxidoreductase [Homoserinimonas aerilata]|uniref:2-polyprenyl-6-methoxyphenol hydroxylase-like FAD-dependent oxidoreductase n=1 Tax=Homoserinimonas aerilata TaxID=1162970 RepID=A0A542YIV3_9MICO|nr:FAD-dependent oxidoreductase [Homoserinimonas aerilata]TQL48002.1 2-polyprenyl-6-methoxyphenol hydroxylase-like FAD-dependent oxidoreductase [Homoserinimonas aerilata]